MNSIFMESIQNFWSQKNQKQTSAEMQQQQVLTQPWTKFWLNIFANFGVFYLFEKMLKPLFL